MKHNIKRVDRLLGNRALHAEIPQLYATLAYQCLAGIKTPLIMIDWSDLTPDRRWQLLRASSMALSGRSVTLYEQVHPLWHAAAFRVHAAFLARLAAMLPSGCVPILLTDAGFRSTWFKLVNRMGWHWVGRIRNRDKRIWQTRIWGQTRLIGITLLPASSAFPSATALPCARSSVPSSIENGHCPMICRV
jgi:hypothetical protein